MADYNNGGSLANAFVDFFSKRTVMRNAGFTHLPGKINFLNPANRSGPAVWASAQVQPYTLAVRSWAPNER